MASRIALLFAHPGDSNFNHAAGREMARRGYRILMLNQEDEDNPADTYAPSTSAALKHLRGLAGVEKVVVITHSGGGHHMAFYQNAAENGAKACAGPEKIYPVSSRTRHRPRQARRSDPAGPDARRVSSDELDRSGRRFGGAAATEAVAGYVRQPQRLRRGQPPRARTRRNSRALFCRANPPSAALIEQARTRLAPSKRAADYRDDEPFVVPGMGISATGAQALSAGRPLVASTRGRTCLEGRRHAGHRDRACPVRPPSGARPDEALATLSVMTQNSTVRRFLAVSAIRTRRTTRSPRRHRRRRLDVRHEQHARQRQGITVPTLVLSMTCHYLMVPDEIIFDHLAAKDKQLVMVEGATHGFTPCRPEYGDTMARTFDYVDGWLKHAGRFAPGASQR